MAIQSANFWHIWLERNARVFANQYTPRNLICEDTLLGGALGEYPWLILSRHGVPYMLSVL